MNHPSVPTGEHATTRREARRAAYAERPALVRAAIRVSRWVWPFGRRPLPTA